MKDKSNVFNILKERGFIEQCTNENKIKDLLNNKKINFYIGFDPTADSLTAGHFLTLMAMSHLQKAGHKPIVLIGGGTGMIGDPSDRTDMRKMMDTQTIAHNVSCFKKQLSKFIDFSNNNAIIVDNGDWLKSLNYIDFIRNIGIHFSVNRMLSAECFKSRMEKGLSFFEFNYMLMQSYDFLELNKRYNCILQLGGNDQWSNILSGIDLIRRKNGKETFGLTLKLLTTSDGKKMGKTQGGAIWLDANKTTPYDFYQYWRNISDDDVIKCLNLLTFIPTEEIKPLLKLKGNDINKAKEILAYEVTKIVHSEELAIECKEASRALFSNSGNTSSIPSIDLNISSLENGLNILEAISKIYLVSKSEARRLIEQGGIKINDEKISSIDYNIKIENFNNNKQIIIQKGKKGFKQINLK